VQKEVAEAIAAEPGKMSLLSVSVQFYGRPEIIGYVPAHCFYPAPEVDSAILRIAVYPRPAVAITDEVKNKSTRGEAQGSPPDTVAQTGQPALLTVKEGSFLVPKSLGRDEQHGLLFYIKIATTPSPTLTGDC